jgi:hypothetical protein
MRSLAAAMLCLVLAGCQPKKSEALRIDPSLEAMVPADTVFVVGANLDAIRETPVYQKLLSRVPLPQLDEFARQTGLDPRRDLSQILSCSNGKHGLLMARGKFNIADLEAKLEARGAKRFGYKNRNLFGNEQGAVFIMNASTAIAGTAEQLRALIDRGNGPGGGLPPPLRDLVRTIPGNYQIWAALTGGLEAMSPNVPPNSNFANIVNALKSIDTATIAMDLSKGFAVKAEVTCKAERDAKFVHDMVKGVVGIGRLNTPDNHPELLKLYDAIQVTQQQTHAQVTADIPTDLADRFLDLWLKR